MKCCFHFSSDRFNAAGLKNVGKYWSFTFVPFIVENYHYAYTSFSEPNYASHIHMWAWAHHAGNTTCTNARNYEEIYERFSPLSTHFQANHQSVSNATHWYFHLFTPFLKLDAFTCLCMTAVSPLLTHWRHCSLAQNTSLWFLIICTPLLF